MCWKTIPLTNPCVCDWPIDGLCDDLVCCSELSELIPQPLNDGLLNMELYQEAKLDVVMPVIFNVGTLDKHFMEGGRNYQQTSEVMKIMASWYGNTKTEEETFKYQTGRFYGYVWTNKDGLPVLQEQWVVDKIHAMIPEETYLLYDFMANYTRGVDGTSYYMGVAIEK